MILAEGYTDVIALHQAGLRNTVGLMGTALTADQVAELSRLAPVVALALDADSAGQEAMLRAAKVAAGRRLELRVVPLPAGADPADLVQAEGPAAMRALVDDVAALRALPGRARARPGRPRLRGGQGPRDRRAAPRLRRAPAQRGARGPHPARRRPDRAGAGAGRLVARAAADRGRRGGGGARAGPRGRRRAATGTPRPAAPPARPTGRTRRRAGCARSGASSGSASSTPRRRARRSSALDLDQAFTSDLHRRAAVHLRDHAADPSSGLPEDDDELASLVAGLVIRAAGQEPSRAALQVEGLKLELAAVERRMAAARDAGSGDIAALAGRRAELKNAVDAAIVRAMED